MCVDNTDEDSLVLPVITQLSQPVEVRRRTNAFTIQLSDDITSMYVNHDQSTECYTVVFGERTAHQVHDVR